MTIYFDVAVASAYKAMFGAYVVPVKVEKGVVVPLVDVRPGAPRDSIESLFSPPNRHAPIGLVMRDAAFDVFRANLGTEHKHFLKSRPIPGVMNPTRPPEQTIPQLREVDGTVLFFLSRRGPDVPINLADVPPATLHRVPSTEVIRLPANSDEGKGPTWLVEPTCIFTLWTRNPFFEGIPQ